jgi:hypothetical protein
MNKLHACFFALISLVLVGCRGPSAAFKDMSPTPTAAISGDWLTVRLGADTKNSAGWVRPKVRLEGRTAYVNGYHTLRFTSLQFSMPLTVPTQMEGLRVVWVNPDGSTVPVPLTKERDSAPVEKADIASVAIPMKSAKPFDHNE